MRRIDVVDRGVQQVAGRGGVGVGREPHVYFDLAGIVEKLSPPEMPVTLRAGAKGNAAAVGLGRIAASSACTSLLP